MSDTSGLRAKVSAALDEWNERAVGAQGWPAMAALEAFMDSEGAAPEGLDVATMMAMEQEGVVTWADEGHRARFLRARLTPAPTTEEPT